MAPGYPGGKYLPEIDGLRAIAILLVVGYHVGLPQLSGGFIGVDVFFVLSGFLITGLLAREITLSGRIDILDFYARRARRLMPALTVVLVFTIAAGAILLDPVGQQPKLAQSAVAASVFLANIFFWRSQSSYFASPADAMPLLHLWTLAVEEQFYIVWPLVLIVVVAVARRWGQEIFRPLVIAVLIVASTASFLLCWYFTFSYSTMTFYATPFRAWEFGLGAILALVQNAPAKGKGSPLILGIGMVLISGGLAAILYAAFWFSRETVFPGLSAALPVVGTTAVIAGTRFAKGSIPARLLASSPMVAIGKLSYSWYLWHWPLLALARAALPEEVAIWRDVGLVLIALALSALTFRYVEEPIRRSRRLPFGSAVSSVTTALILMSVTGGLAALLLANASFQVEHDPVLKAAAKALSEKVKIPVECTNFRLPFAGLAPSDDCTLGKPAGMPFVVLWGDSHAYHFVPGLERWAKESGARLLPRTMGSCKPHVTHVSLGLAASAYKNAESCIAFNTAVLATLPTLRAAGASAVILAGRWSVPSELQNGLGNWGTELRARIMNLRAMGFEVILFAETPIRKTNVPQCVARYGATACGRPRAEVDAERAASLKILLGLAANIDGVRVWDPVGEVCNHQTCPAIRNGQVLFSDDSHLSVAGSNMLAPSLGKFLSGFSK